MERKINLKNQCEFNIDMLDTKKYAQQFLEFMEIVQENGHVCNISTITLIGSLSIKKISLETILDNVKDSIYTVKVSKKNHQTVTKRGKIKKTFFNQITLNYKDISNKSIKIFSNGIFHITGLTCYLECNLVSMKLRDLIKQCVKDESVSITDLRIGMINNNFCCNHDLNLRMMIKSLKMCNYVARYNPESYPAINLKYNNTSIFIFGSGNIVITGSKSLEEIVKTYRFITDFIKDKEFCKTQNQKAKKQVEYMHGYSIRHFISCLHE
tara:strand:+ start:123 stop:926 length:804 start_codon:yes stop_codon:yes gene_type:complete